MIRQAQHGNVLRDALTRIAFLVLIACEPQLSDDPIPETFFADIVIITTFPQYNALTIDGGIYQISNKGVRGIMVYRQSSTAFFAFEKNCSYHPNDACATVDVHSSNLFMIDACCGSNFNFSGDPTGGPAWRPLRRYETSLIGTEITITSESANGM